MSLISMVVVIVENQRVPKDVIALVLFRPNAPYTKLGDKIV